MTKILLAADLHIHTHKNSLKRLQHCLEALEWIFETAIERGIDNLIFLGDLFQDREKIQVLTYQRTYEIINKYTGGENPLLNLYLLVGNHDMWYANQTDISSVYPFNSISNVRIVRQCETISIDGFDVDFLPFTLNPAKSIEVFQNPSKILCGHIALDGAQLNTFHHTHADVSVEYDGDMVKVDKGLFKSWDRVFLGHYHGEQKLGHVEYIGSPLQLNFSEAFQKKHIGILSTDDLSVEYIENTFSPKHFIINEDQIDKYNLENSFVKFMPKNIASTDLVDVRQKLIEEHNILTFEYTSPENAAEDDSTKQHLKDAKIVLTTNEIDTLEKYVDSSNFGNLDKSKLLEIGNLIRQKSGIE